MRYFSKKIIDSNILKQNFYNLKAKSNCNICAVVKADAYGHGIMQVVETLNECDFFAVQNVVEGAKVRQINKNAKVLVLGFCSDYDFACANNLSIMVDSVLQLKDIIRLNKKINIHLKINTGMNRLGFGSVKEFKTALKLIKQNRNINIEGIFTHCFCCDNQEITDRQLKKFSMFTKLCKGFGFLPIVHVGGSGIVNYNLKSIDYIRCGLFLYGYGCNLTKPIMKIVSKVLKITKIKKGEFVGYDCVFAAQDDMTIGLVPFGYADGINIKQNSVMLGENKVNIVGKICMDMFMIDITGLDAKVGDTVTIFESATKWAKFLGVSEYQVLTSLISARTENIVV